MSAICPQVAPRALALSLLACTLLAAAPARSAGNPPAARVDTAYIVANASTSTEWPTVGLDYAESRYSRLDQVNTDTAGRLGLVWSYDLKSSRGVEATPVVVDGVMYVTGPWSVVHAIDARTGEGLWTYDPQVPPEYGVKGCCDVVNRGVAVYGGKVYVAAFDGRLIALDAATGKPAWEQDTIIDRQFAYTVTGAPRVYNGLVLIGNGGAEYGARGYITAYDAASGERKWRWFSVPGDPAQPFEDVSMEMAAKTWDPAGRWWESGGGGTMWDSMAYDPELNLIYVGTGNGSPWNHRARSPAGGDNLFLSSIVALRADTGEYVWHYQETPGDNWDYTATQSIILADITLDGKPRKVLLHAPKNGFFFVIDRIDGQFISANNFVDVNWAAGYDAQGRPIERPEVRAEDQPFDIVPGPYGAHNWHPMSFNAKTGYAYIPAQHIPMTLMPNAQWKRNEAQPGSAHSNVGWNTGHFLNPAPPSAQPFGRLVAWDPVAGKPAWAYEHVAPWNGGTLTTAGNLVFQGTADGRLIAFAADSGKKIWEVSVGTGAVAAPSTYLVDGKQYVSIAVGWGGVGGLAMRATDVQGSGTVYTFALDGKAPMPAFVATRQEQLVSGVAYDPARVQAGLNTYVANCVLCHGVPGVDRGGSIPNLGHMDAAYINHLDQFLFNGPATSRGMPDFTGKLTQDDVADLKAFIQGTVDSVRPKAAL
ncbi:PQQ-dependent dehydrogenase, methanol/ethanol family [Verticiella sediminum]|uniref:PQQ-dependent dehydrogenase, methanol/ethanol family n=1 Tax=Verticiella sediminum TaxID=1247510 RepID=A0A556B207_9BURK|nr:PQQ-dependent dehydrogenase, methanol/ethanol family [Verticiella sediminum]TSH99221.1 PQQ-dependent dehydrogenase, methanol/ethanol family [Verticiella sediminum]